MVPEKTSALFLTALALALPLTLSTPVFAQHPLPAGWLSIDVGAVGLPGSGTQGSDGDLFIAGAGSDIWGSQDSFHFVYQQGFLDGEIGSNGTFQENTHPFAKIGLMIRESLDPGSPHVIIDVKPDGSVEFMARSVQGGDTRFIGGLPSHTGGGGLHLIRRSGVITGMICGNTCQIIGSAPFPSEAALVGAVITSHDPSKLNHGGFAANLPYVFHLPQPWQDYDIGNVGLTGHTFFWDDMFEVQGAGADIWGTSDSYHLLANYMKGDGEIVTRVKAEYANHAFAKAGVIMTAGDGTTVLLDIRPFEPIEFMARPAAGAQMQFIAGSSSTFPVWLKLERTGNLFTGSMSQDGKAWQVVGTTTIAMPEVITAGLAVTSHDTASYNTSWFDHVLDASRVPLSVDIGDVGIAGMASLATNSTVVTMQGGGADIWGTADAFNYYYQFLKDEGELAVKVNGLEDTATYAKAGVMIRDGIDPSAAHVMIDVTPSGLIELLTRTSTGEETQWIGGLSNSSFPIWLKLARSGASIAASASHDGSTWIPVGTASPEMPSGALIGVAVTSHQRGAVTTATWDNLSR
jgi:regulation of enolase protein 1 (concanavalin A-like superfamily)